MVLFAACWTSSSEAWQVVANDIGREGVVANWVELDCSIQLSQCHRAPQMAHEMAVVGMRRQPTAVVLTCQHGWR